MGDKIKFGVISHIKAVLSGECNVGEIENVTASYWDAYAMTGDTNVLLGAIALGNLSRAVVDEYLQEKELNDEVNEIEERGLGV